MEQWKPEAWGLSSAAQQQIWLMFCHLFIFHSVIHLLFVSFMQAHNIFDHIYPVDLSCCPSTLLNPSPHKSSYSHTLHDLLGLLGYLYEQGYNYWRVASSQCYSSELMVVAVWRCSECGRRWCLGCVQLSTGHAAVELTLVPHCSSRDHVAVPCLCPLMLLTAWETL